MIAPYLGGGRPACPDLPPVIGHRGAAGRAPENTLAGLRQAKALGCSWVEFDVRLTADGGLVLLHDSTLERTTDGRGQVAARRLADIRQLDAGRWFAPSFAGERVPTLEEALLLAAELSLSANIEIKADRGLEGATAAEVAAVLRRLAGRLPPLAVSSFLTPALRAFRELAPSMPRGLIFRTVPWRWRATAAQLGVTMLVVNHRVLGRRLVASIRDAGYPVLSYSTDDPERAKELYGWGVTSVISYLPDVLLASAAEQPGSCARPTAS